MTTGWLFSRSRESNAARKNAETQRRKIIPVYDRAPDRNLVVAAPREPQRHRLRAGRPEKSKQILSPVVSKRRRAQVHRTPSSAPAVGRAAVAKYLPKAGSARKTPYPWIIETAVHTGRVRPTRECIPQPERSRGRFGACADTFLRQQFRRSKPEPRFADDAYSAGANPVTMTAKSISPIANASTVASIRR